MPFRAFTLRVADQPNGLSTALAMYYMPGRKAHVIGRGVSLDELPFENVSKEEPMFIQNFGCLKASDMATQYPRRVSAAC